MARRSPTPRWLPKRRLWQMDAQYKGNRKSFILLIHRRKPDRLSAAANGKRGKMK